MHPVCRVVPLGLSFQRQSDPPLSKAQAPEPTIQLRASVPPCIVKSLSQCIEWAALPPRWTAKGCSPGCLYVKNLDETEMNYCLAAIERTLD